MAGCRKWETTEYSALKETYVLYPSSPVVGIDYKDSVSSGHLGAAAHMNHSGPSIELLGTKCYY